MKTTKNKRTRNKGKKKENENVQAGNVGRVDGRKHGRGHVSEQSTEGSVRPTVSVPTPSTQPIVGSTQVLTPTQQAIENWKARQQNVPWFWLSFTINKVFKGIVIVQGWNFLDAVNTANKMKVSIPMAQIYGEELEDTFVARVNQVNRLLTRKQAEKVFKGVKEVDEVELFKPEPTGPVDFTGFDGVKEFNPNI